MLAPVLVQVQLLVQVQRWCSVLRCFIGSGYCKSSKPLPQRSIHVCGFSPMVQPAGVSREEDKDIEGAVVRSVNGGDAQSNLNSTDSSLRCSRTESSRRRAPTQNCERRYPTHTLI